VGPAGAVPFLDDVKEVVGEVAAVSGACGECPESSCQIGRQPSDAFVGFSVESVAFGVPVDVAVGILIALR
jgi:hypothetical protein